MYRLGIGCSIAMAVLTGVSEKSLAQKPKLRTTHRRATAEVRALAFSPDGQVLASPCVTLFGAPCDVRSVPPTQVGLTGRR